MVSALIFAGGIGQRMKSLDIPKQFLEIEGKPIIVRTMEHFSNHPMVDNIVVVCVENWLDVLNQDIEKFGIKKVIKNSSWRSNWLSFYSQWSVRGRKGCG